MDRRFRSSGRDIRSRRARAVLLVGVALAVGAFVLLASPGVDAKQKFMSLFAQAYPEAAGTPLDSCLLCHRNAAAPTEDNLNPYGEDWEDGDYGDKNFLASRLVHRDSDGDGVPNGQEIAQLSFPGSASSSTPPATTTTIPGTPIDGEALFASRCAACHGSGGGDLSGTALGRAAFTSITLSGRGAMPAQAGLTDAEVGAIWDYVTGSTPATTTTTTTLPGATTTTTVPRSGAAVWADSCAVCHGPSGGNVVPTGLSRSQLVSVVTNGVGSMRGFPELGSAQIANVADYLLGFGATTTTTTLPGATTTTTVPRSGAAVWADSCAVCHGPSGGNLQGHSMSLSAIVSATTNGIGTMPGYSGRLSEGEISNVSRYVHAVGEAGGPAPTTVPPGPATAGATLYMQVCSGCHGIHGEGGPGGPIDTSVLDREEMIAVIGVGVGSMPGYDSTLSAEEIAAIADHVVGMTAGIGEAPTTPIGGEASPLVTPQAPTTTTPDTTAATPTQTDAGPAPAMSARPLESGGANPLIVVALGTLVLGALVMGGRSLRSLTLWSGDD